MQPKDLAEFILYVIPGFIALETYRFVYPAKKRHHFYTISWSIVNGLFISIFIKYILKLYGVSFGLNFWTSILILVISVELGLIRVCFRQIHFKFSLDYDTYIKYFPPWLIPDPQTIWAAIQSENKDNWALVYLNDGSTYFGFISRYSFDPDLENQDFLLIKASKLKGNNETDYDIDGLGVYINTKDVLRVEYHQGESIENETEKKPSFFKKLFMKTPPLVPRNEQDT